MEKIKVDGETFFVQITLNPRKIELFLDKDGEEFNSNYVAHSYHSVEEAIKNYKKTKAWENSCKEEIKGYQLVEK